MIEWVDLRNWAAFEEHALQADNYWEDAEWPILPRVEFEEWLKERDETLDAAVDHYLDCGLWTDLARDEKPALFYRLGWVQQLCSLLAHPDAKDEVIVPNPRDRNSTLRWALVDIWPIFGRGVVVRFHGH